jgi:cell division septation protein DedD
LLAKQADAKPPVPVATLLAKKMFLPKPSAIQPVLIQPRTNVAYLHGVPMPPNPYEAAQLPWKWTPPFDVVHPSSSHTRLSRPRDARLNSPSAAHANAMQTNSAPPDQASALPSAHSAVVIQIAALSRQDDAQVLTDALRKHGFPASIHNGNDDTLYHVEMGPLERRTALAAQQRLIARGYNATVKQ